MRHLLCSVLVFALVGCSGNSGQTVEGKVVFGDGSPLGIGAVMISNGKNSYSGAIQSDGTYKLVNVLAGDYRVAITGSIVGGTENKEFEMNYDANGNYIPAPEGKPPVHLVKESMGNPDTSNLTLKVPGTYEIKVEKP